jgi:hypothetical protein
VLMCFKLGVVVVLRRSGSSYVEELLGK